jgi:hypothetical protein
MRRGFIVLEINRQPVRSAGDFERLTARTRPVTFWRFTVTIPPRSSGRS